MPVFPCFSCIQILRHPLWPRSSAVSLPSRNISRYSHWLLSTSNNGGSFAWHLPLAVSRAFPSPDSGYGLHGLLALQEYQRQRYGVPLNFLGDWQNQINHLLAQEEAYRRELPGELKEALVQLSA